jgi:hypothetical protein
MLPNPSMKIAASPLHLDVHDAFQFPIHPFYDNGKLQSKPIRGKRE